MFNDKVKSWASGGDDWDQKSCHDLRETITRKNSLHWNIVHPTQSQLKVKTLYLGWQRHSLLVVLYLWSFGHNILILIGHVTIYLYLLVMIYLYLLYKYRPGEEWTKVPNWLKYHSESSGALKRPYLQKIRRTEQNFTNFDKYCRNNNNFK